MSRPHQTQQITEPYTQIPTKILFSSQVYGKPTKNRSQDPSMFDLLKWNNQGIQVGNFKKKQHFKNSQQAYLNMISKQPWTSQTQESYVNCMQSGIDVNPNIFSQIQNYVQSHRSEKDKTNLAKGSKSNKMIVQQNKSKQVWNGHKKISSKEDNPKNHINQKDKQKNLQNNQGSRLVKRPNSARNISKLKSAKNQTNYIPSGLFHTDPQEKAATQKRDQITQQQQAKLIQKFKQTTRWIPNSSFTTYFGRPPFQNYGRGNTKPVDGGLVYGTYLYSHNVHPHRGSNSPANVQTYPVALMKAKSQGNLIPTQPKTLCNYIQNKINNQKQKKYDNYGSIEAAKNVYGHLEIQVPDLSSVEKFGGKTKQFRKSEELTKSKLTGK